MRNESNKIVKTEYWFTGQLHREDGPAVECDNGHKEWRFYGKLHREDGPAIEYFNGSKEWYINGQLHREDGPAVVMLNGGKEWWINGSKLTEEEFSKATNANGINPDPRPWEGIWKRTSANGLEEWFLNNLRHREDGPAFIGIHGYKEWWLHGVQLKEEQFELFMQWSKSENK